MTTPFDSTAALDRLDTGEKTPEHLRIAIIVTLLDAAHAANSLGSEELTRISSRLSTLFGLSNIEIGHEIQVAELIRLDSERKQKFLTQLRQNFSLIQRQEILSLAWRIIIIDGVVCQNEAAVAVEIRKNLELSMEAAVAARIRAEQYEAELLAKEMQYAQSTAEEEQP